MQNTSPRALLVKTGTKTPPISTDTVRRCGSYAAAANVTLQYVYFRSQQHVSDGRSLIAEVRL